MSPAAIGYRFGRNMRGDLVAKTVLPLGDDTRRELHIETSKRYGGGVDTSATVMTRTEDGLGLQRCFGLGASGEDDFRLTLEAVKGMRCTEKAVRAMHERNLERANDVLNQARGYYVSRAGNTNARIGV